jgi:general secretion pathway protein N
LIQTKRGLLLVAALTVALALIVMFPARVVYHWVAPTGIAVSGIHGTVWRGRADAISIGGIYLADVSWRLQPLHLFTAKARYHMQGSPVSGFVEGDVGIGIGGSLSVSNLSASLPLQLFAKSLHISGLAGDASLRFDRIKVRDGLPVAANGTVQVNNLVAPRLSRDPIGGYQAEFFTQNNGVTATVEDTDGVLDLAGSFQIKDDRSYQFLGKVVAKPQAPASLQRQLEYLGSADERGQRELRLEGTL